MRRGRRRWGWGGNGHAQVARQHTEPLLTARQPPAGELGRLALQFHRLAPGAEAWQRQRLGSTQLACHAGHRLCERSRVDAFLRVGSPGLLEHRGERPQLRGDLQGPVRTGHEGTEHGVERERN